jgi:hypothetical protein
MKLFKQCDCRVLFSKATHHGVLQTLRYLGHAMVQSANAGMYMGYVKELTSHTTKNEVDLQCKDDQVNLTWVM